MRCGLIGEKLSHSYSAVIHQMLGEYRYDLINLPPHSLDEFFTGKNFDGVNVTIPYKKAVIPYCDILDDTARRVGSVNTIVRDRNDLLHGYNTDYFGFSTMCERAGIRFDNKKVLILGTGGTSLTAHAVAADGGAREILSVSRTGSVNYSNLYQHSDSDIIINTTPVGMYPENGKKLVELSAFPRCSGVIDVIYNPLRTRLLLDAKELGIPRSGGLPMLVAQAKLASELFTGEKIPEQRIDEVLDRLFRSVCNIVLVGMPGSGKTEIGKLIANRLDREAIDIDDQIMQKAGMSIPEIFDKLGEPTFRRLESEAVEESCKLAGKVISTGGGAVMSEDNRRSMRQNGLVCFLERDIDKLQTAGRPLSKSPEALRQMYSARLPLYTDCSDAVISNNNTEVETAEAILEVFHAYSCD